MENYLYRRFSSETNRAYNYNISNKAKWWNFDSNYEIIWQMRSLTKKMMNVIMVDRLEFTFSKKRKASKKILN